MYRRLPPGDEAALVAGLAPPPATVLDLGCGTGRVADVLAARGYVVTGVDNSPAMLAHVRLAEPIHADIATLDLGRRFDVVLLASHFVNDAERERRRAWLRACERHVAAGGAVLVQSYPPDAEWTPGPTRRIGDVAVTLVAADVDGRRVRACVEYEVDGRSWRQDFEAELLDDAALADALADAGLEFADWLDRDRGWLLARPRA